ncbi:hypothetical protein ECG_09143 [Echinococcus granulosus]|uniref:Zinc finger C2H2 n=1 Tax=Echinococcus granulosus TaxID=6210 RepID=U6JFJ4_ECHGR|nr:hypothetical protein EGR_05685 [Echinococcus granulosus]EUB59434.1 hypothetical protein EGR_05685 [Echinococcus granulosus]KAH9278710.1 hypothetical protein ECG_09143 [Echinococcus granulosus]CDS21260.1 Zinc finger C2H2 [Echinococcus granulosus]
MFNNSSPESKDLSRRPAKAKHALIKSPVSPISVNIALPQRKRAKIIRFTTDDFTWQCWQCLSAFSSNVDLDDHLKDCDSRNAAEGDVILPMGDSLPGCPFCPRDGCQAESKPYYFHDFNAHVGSQHSEVKELSCPYCTDKIPSPRLEDLTSHILLDHQIHWRPSPASMVYQRTDDVAHRVVTCLGCGWCTFVLRAQDAVQPPASLASHMSRCAGRGARLSVPRLPPYLRRPTQVPTRALVSALTAASASASHAFAVRFPGVRGYVASTFEATATGPGTSSWSVAVDAEGDGLPQKRPKYQPPLKVASPVSITVPSPPPEGNTKLEEEEVKAKEKGDEAEELKPTLEEEKLTNGNEPTLSPQPTAEAEAFVKPGSTSPVKHPQAEEQQQEELQKVEEKENENETAKMENKTEEEDEQPPPQQQPTPAPQPRKRTTAATTPTPASLRKNAVPKGVFDVPLDLPPSPPPSSTTATDSAKKPASTRVYVCPICGDNALSSLRERDKHLQVEHTGELVFPCQLCGMAYPVYIALRRHAVLKHAANFDAVLYGQPDMEPVECPFCELVAFTSPEVLQLHLAKIHPEQFEQQAVVSAVASALAAPDSDSDAEGGGRRADGDDKDDKDWEVENGSKVGGIASAPAASAASVIAAATRLEGGSGVRRVRGRGGRRGRSKSLGAPIYTSADLLNDPDLLESVENSLQMRRSFTPGRRGRGRGRGRGSGGAGAVRSRGTGRRGRPRGSTRAFGIHTATAATTVATLHQSLAPVAQQQLNTCTVITGAAVHSVEGVAVAPASVIDGMELPPPPNAVSQLEMVLAQTSPDHALVTCRLCGAEAQVVLDNAKELYIHMELDHNPESTCEQLGCQACGRIFFGPHHRGDLIGHIRVMHQGQEEAMPCPNHAAEGGCGAKFTSTRLRDSHLLMTDAPGWSCPLQLAAESLQAVTEVAEAGGAAAEIFDTMVLATEIAADAVGQMVLAYGCPLCSRVFVGQNCTARYLAHQSQCGAVGGDEVVSMEADQSHSVMVLATVADNTQ